MTLSSVSMYVVFVDPHKGSNNVMPFLFLQLKLMWSLCVGRKLEHTCNAYIVKSNNGSKESWVIQSNQDVHMCGYTRWIYVVANLILPCFLKTSLSWNLEIFLQENWNYLIHLFFFFLGGHLSTTHCFKYRGHLCVHFFWINFA